MLTTAKLNATGLRWVADLAEFDFTIKYRPGKENVDADCLSRRPLEIFLRLDVLGLNLRPEMANNPKHVLSAFRYR